MRNRFAHSEEKDPKKLEKNCLKVREYRAFYNSTFHSIDSPNNYDKIDFNDFLLFTNIVKNIGYTLCEKCKPDNQKLAERLSTLEIKIASKTISPLKNIFKLKNDPKRFSDALAICLTQILVELMKWIKMKSFNI